MYLLVALDVEEDEEGCITSFTITPLQPVFKGARTYKLGAPTEAVSAAQPKGLRSSFTIVAHHMHLHWLCQPALFTKRAGCNVVFCVFPTHFF